MVRGASSSQQVWTTLQRRTTGGARSPARCARRRRWCSFWHAAPPWWRRRTSQTASRRCVRRRHAPRSACQCWCPAPPPRPPAARPRPRATRAPRGRRRPCGRARRGVAAACCRSPPWCMPPAGAPRRHAPWWTVLGWRGSEGEIRERAEGGSRPAGGERAGRWAAAGGGRLTGVGVSLRAPWGLAPASVMPWQGWLMASVEGLRCERLSAAGAWPRCSKTGGVTAAARPWPWRARSPRRRAFGRCERQTYLGCPADAPCCSPTRW